MSRKDLIDICGPGDGIRLFNLLRMKYVDGVQRDVCHCEDLWFGMCVCKGPCVVQITGSLSVCLSVCVVWVGGCVGGG